MRYLETSLEKIARILSRQYNIDVTFEGEKAFTNGQRIVLPFFQEVTEELEKDLNGYLDHEVAHVKFTQFVEVPKVISAFHKETLNAAEDIRIERLMMQEFPGTEYHLVPLREKLNAKIDKNWFSRPWPIRFLIALMRIMDGNKPYPQDKEIQTHLDNCQAEIDQLNQCRSTKEIRVVTEAIVRKLIKDRQEELEKAAQQQQQQQKSKSEEKKQNESNGKKDKQENKEEQKSKSEKEEKSDSPKEKGEKSQEKSNSQKEEQNQDKDGQKSQEEKQGQSNDNSSESKDGEGQSSETQTPEVDQKMSAKKKAGDSWLNEKNEDKFDQFEIDVHRMINAQIEKQTAKEQKQLEAQKYNYKYQVGTAATSIPFTTRFDRLTDHSGSNKSNSYARLRQEVKPMVNTLKSNLEKIFKSVENARWKSEREQGLINSRSLATMVSNPNYRTVFKELNKFETDKVAVSILIDLSGSMHGQKVETAKRAASAMGEALAGLGINFEVVGFRTTSGNGSMLAREMKVSNLSRFNRVSEALDHFVFKSFECQSLVGLSHIEAGGSNNDGESVMWAAKRLGQRSEKRKVLLVMSDGMPAGEGDSAILQSDLRVKLAQIEKFGIETVGIGILTDDVKHFYKDFAVINNLKDLTSTCLKKISTILTKNLPMRR